jgi:small subunit ribosomal protein S16
MLKSRKLIINERKENNMAVKIRMTRIGRRHRPFFRINAVESREPRDGRILEKLGHYDPIEKDIAKQIVLDKERVKYWLDKGAIPSDTVSQILLRQGIQHKYAEERAKSRTKARAIASSKGKLFNKAQKIAAQKEAEAVEEKAKAEAEAEAKAEEEKAKAKAEEEKAKTEAEAEEKAEAEAQIKEKTEPEVEEKTETKTEKEPESKAKPKAKKKDKAEAASQEDKTQVEQKTETEPEEKAESEAEEKTDS